MDDKEKIALLRKVLQEFIKSLPEDETFEHDLDCPGPRECVLCDAKEALRLTEPEGPAPILFKIKI